MNKHGSVLARLPLIITLTVLLGPSWGCAAVPGKAAIASADPRATDAGLEVLAAGGNAFDAAVAVAATLGVVEPAASGLGGGGFFLLYLADEDTYRFVDARERAPLASTADMYLDAGGEPVPGATGSGPLAAGIPGEAAGMAHIAEHYARLPLAQLLAPAIRHAEEGVPMSPRTQMGLRFRKSSIRQSPAMAAVFLHEGEPVELGTVIRQPDLAATLRRFAEGGFDGFYRGETARLLVDGVQVSGGIWTLDDLANYRVSEREPVIVEYNGMKVVSAPPPSSGGVALTQMFNFLSGYDMGKLTAGQRSHYLIEGMRRVYRDRALYMGDGDFVQLPLAMLTSPEYMAGQRVSVRADRATPSENLAGISGDGSEGSQTTHFSIIDKDGNRVAATITVNTWYGAAFVAPGTGVILNNEMDDFAIKPGVPNEFDLIGNEVNAIEPGKRPLSSMSPTFLESERGIAIVGTPGGSRIITMVLHAALAWQEGASADEMVSMKRFHHQYLPDVVNYEEGAFTAAELEQLASLGHTMQLARRPFGNMNVVTWDFATGEVAAATDPRGEGEGRVY